MEFMSGKNRFNKTRFWITFMVFCGSGLFNLVGLGGGVHAGQREKLLESAYRMQGEYEGRIVLPDFPRWSGLQVVATGLNRFDAYLLDGGLPGAGWDRAGRQLFQGEGNPNVTLTRPGTSLRLKVLDQYPGIVFVFQGNYRVGTLRKVFRRSPTLGLEPPARGIVLFRDADHHRLKNVQINPDGTLGIGAETIDQVRNVRLHVEFRTPFDPEKSGQARGNSGVYIQRRYEVQILDSFGLDLEPNRCGGLYRQKSADINMAFPPGSWQSYDIYFFAAKFDEQGKRIQKARITVVQNGVKIHDNYELLNKTGAGRPEAPTPGPIWFQNHGDPVQFRNLWMVPLEDGEILPEDLNPAYGIFEAGLVESLPAVNPSSNLDTVPECCLRGIGRIRGRLFGK